MIDANSTISDTTCLMAAAVRLLKRGATQIPAILFHVQIQDKADSN